MNDTLVVERVPIESIVLDPANLRRHPETNIEAIKASFARWGQQKPIVVGQGNVVIAGNGQLAAARALGWTEIAIVRSTLTGADAVAFAIADNRTAELAEWDDEALAIADNRTAELAEWDDEALGRVLEQLQADGLLEASGFTDGELDELLAAAVEVGPCDDPGPDEPPVNPVSRAGDLWILGDHRLLCGDSTKADDVDRLMAGAKAALVATDPPYLVDYTGERPNDSGKDWTENYREIDIKDADAFFRAVFTNVKRVVAPNAAIYCWHAHKRSGDIQRIWRDLGLLDHQQIIWLKPTPVFGRVYWHFRHEPCMMGWVQGSKPDHDGQHEFDSVWEIDWQGKARVSGNEHPTEKPVEIFARPMRKHTRRGDVVYEPFSGSGSQLIAAEQEGRRCRAMEISPAFVDVAIRRWEKATGQAANLEETGASYAATEERRLT